MALARKTEAACDGEAALHPGAPFAEQAGDLTWAVMVLVDERAHHAGFIECGEGAGWGVGGQQQAFVFGASCRRLDHHGQLAHAVLGIGRQALEAVDDLEAVCLLGGNDTNG